MLPWGLGLALSLVLPAFAAKRNRLDQSREAAVEVIRQLLKSCAGAFGHPQRHVRTNLMFPVEGNEHRRFVRAETAFNMHDDPDQDLEIDATAGVSGEAFVQHRPAYGDLTLGLPPGGRQTGWPHYCLTHFGHSVSLSTR